MRRFTFAMLWTWLFLIVHIGQAAAAAPPGGLAEVENLQSTLAHVAEQVSPSVVAIRSERRLTDEPVNMPQDELHQQLKGGLFPAVGSGILIDPMENDLGLVLTNEHVIHGADPENITCILSNGQMYTVKALTSDPRSDLAVLRIEANGLPTARLGDAGDVRQGHFAIVMGNPFGTAWESQGRPAMSFGIISALGRPLTRQLDPLGQRYYGDLIQTDAKINPGNSGGPLLNIHGEVIGITTAISTRSGGSEGVGYAIPIDKRTRRIIEYLARGWPVEYGLLGVQLDSPSNRDRQIAGGPERGGAVVRTVERGTPADEIELAPGDLIGSFDGIDIQNVDHLIRVVGSAQVGVPVDLVYYRSGRQYQVQVAPARRNVPTGVNIEEPLNWQGMTLSDISAEDRDDDALPGAITGVMISDIRDDSQAAGEGVRVGQIITRMNDTNIENVRHLRSLLMQTSGPYRLTLQDKDEPIEIP